VQLDQRRLDLTALAAGTVAEAAMFAILALVGDAGRPAAILFYLEAIVLGWLFGARAGMLGAAVPFSVIALADIALVESQRAVLLTATLFVALTLAFTAGMVGALRDRYARPRAGPARHGGRSR
jgi:hypothetical protein